MIRPVFYGLLAAVTAARVLTFDVYDWGVLGDVNFQYPVVDILVLIALASIVVRSWVTTIFDDLRFWGIVLLLAVAYGMTGLYWADPVQYREFLWTMVDIVVPAFLLKASIITYALDRSDD